VTLRKDIQLGKEVVLLQSDPYSKSDYVPLRHPSCKNKNFKATKRGQGKQDLYLCCDHREELKSRICEAFGKEEIEFSIGEFSSETGRYEGYTSLIGVLEGAYRDARKLPTITDTSEIVEEAILNVRNFWTITSTLLNPDDGKLGIALPPVLHIFRLMLQNPRSMDQLLQSLLGFHKKSCMHDPLRLRGHLRMVVTSEPRYPDRSVCGWMHWRSRFCLGTLRWGHWYCHRRVIGKFYWQRDLKAHKRAHSPAEPGQSQAGMDGSFAGKWKEQWHIRLIQTYRYIPLMGTFVAVCK